MAFRLQWPMALLAALASGCAIDLDESSETPDSGEPLPLASGCPLLGGAPGSSIAATRMRSVPLDVDRLLWLGESGALLSSANRSPCDSDGVSEAPRLIEPGPDGSGVSFAARDGVMNDGTLWLWYAQHQADPEAEFGQRAIGLGVLGVPTSPLQSSAPGTLLWTADRPNYGSAALVEDGHAYLWGCLAARFLSADCYLARAPLDALNELAAYEYSRGGDRWTSQVDDAWPLVEAGTEISVARLGEGDYLMAYATPLAKTITMRSGLGPAGPWSAPREVARCTVPVDPEAFCHRVELHSEVVAEPGQVALSYSIGSFDGARVAARPDEYRDVFLFLQTHD